MPATKPVTPPSEKLCGRMIVELIDTGNSRPFPRITFDEDAGGVGRFTPALINEWVAHFSQEIQRAQAKLRHEHRIALQKENA